MKMSFCISQAVLKVLLDHSPYHNICQSTLLGRVVGGLNGSRYMFQQDMAGSTKVSLSVVLKFP